jgi:signal transduction histidine kinase
MTHAGTLPYALPPAVAIVAGVVIIAMVFRWAPRSPSRRPFVLMVAGLVGWGAAILGMRLSTTLGTALAWDRWAGVGVMLLFLGFYHFSLNYVGAFGRRRFLTVAYILLAVFVIATPAGLMVESIRLEDYGYAPVPGVLALPASVIAITLLVAGGLTLLRRYRTSSSYEEKNRLLNLMVAASLAFVGPVLDLFTNLPPVGIWTNIAFCAITAIALLEYRLLDIPRVARYTLTYLLLGVMVASPYVVVVFLLQRYMGARLESIWGYIISVLVLAVLLRPLYSAASELVDRLFFRERYDSLRALERFGREAHYSVDLTELSYRLTRLVTDALHSTCTCLFLPSGTDGDFELFHCEGLVEPPQADSLRADGALIRWLDSHPEILVHRTLDIEPPLQSLSRRERALLEAINARVLVPIAASRGGLSGLLVLGPKGPAGEYSGEDRRLLDALGNQMAIALENARLYSDALRARRDLERWLDGMDDSVVIFGPDKLIRFLNRSARETLHLRLGDPCHKVLGGNGHCSTCERMACAEEAESGLHMSRTVGLRQYDVVSAELTDPDGSPSILSVLRDVTERNRFEEELRRSRERMRELAAHLESAREQERTGIARELHDELGQMLTALKMDLSWLSRHDREASAAVHEKVHAMISMVDTTIHAVQRISSELRPGILDDLGLAAALEWLARTFEQKSGIPCDVELDESVSPGGSVSTALFRICQESLTNVARHSGATRASVTLRRKGASISLSIGDNGRGVTAEETENAMSFGFIGMRERARGIGGRLAVTGSPGSGTVVEVVVPDR